MLIALQLFYFDLDGGVPSLDHDGMMLRDVEHAHHEALERAAEFACDAARLKDPGAVVVTVRNAAGSVALIVRLVCSVEVPDETEVRAGRWGE